MLNNDQEQCYLLRCAIYNPVLDSFLLREDFSWRFWCHRRRLLCLTNKWSISDGRLSFYLPQLSSWSQSETKSSNAVVPSAETLSKPAKDLRTVAGQLWRILNKMLSLSGINSPFVVDWQYDRYWSIIREWIIFLIIFGTITFSPFDNLYVRSPNGRSTEMIGERMNSIKCSTWVSENRCIGKRVNSIGEPRPE